MRKMLKGFKKDFMYTWKHKKAILEVEKEIFGRNTIDGYLHDVDKLFLYLIFTKKETSKIHRKYSKHHTGNHKNEKDIVNALIDWDSARRTKPDKQETPKQYLLRYIPEYTETYKPVMKKLNMW